MNDKIDTQIDEILSSHGGRSITYAELNKKGVHSYEQYILDREYADGVAKKQIQELIVEAQVKLLEHLATSDPKYTMAALKDELAALKSTQSKTEVGGE